MSAGSDVNVRASTSSLSRTGLTPAARLMA